MCCKQTEKEKAKEAPFFPFGWTFFFQGTEDAETSNTNPADNNKGLVLVAPDGKKHYSVVDAISSQTGLDKEVRKDSFNRYVGFARWHNSKTVGSRCYGRWIDNNWFPGIISKVVGEGSSSIFSVGFDCCLK